MIPCVFITETAEAVVCRRCGRRVPTIYAAEPERVHANCRGVPLGLGDTVAWLLVATGIMALWYRFRPRKKCGCAKRQSWLNRWCPYPRFVRGWLAYLKLWRTTYGSSGGATGGDVGLS